MAQASAGTGKSYLLVAVCLWCILHKKKFKAAAPTGIAAANIEVPGTDIVATTIHTFFNHDTDFKTKCDLANLEDGVVQALLAMQVLLLDEVSMVDDEWWSSLEKILSTLNFVRHPPRGAGPDHLGKALSAHARRASCTYTRLSARVSTCAHKNTSTRMRCNQHARRANCTYARLSARVSTRAHKSTSTRMRCNRKRAARALARDELYLLNTFKNSF